MEIEMLLVELKVALLLLSVLVVTAAPPTVPCNTSLAQLAVTDSTVVLANATLQPGCQQILWIAGSACDNNSYLQLELWDLDEVGLGAGEIIPSLPRAQPLLVMARGSIPLGYYNMTAGTWAFSAPGSVSDVAGEDLLRPYLQVQSLFGTAGSQTIPGSSNCTDEAPCWYVTLLNSNMLMNAALEYQLRASCSASPQCPSPNWNSTIEDVQPCSNHGKCQVAVSSPPASAMCVCDAGWGDVGCNEGVTPLINNQTVVVPALGIGLWDFFEVYIPIGESKLLVEMTRTRGDPILFVKRQDEGFQAGALPSSLDYSSFADRIAWRERSDLASILRTNLTAGLYYVGVFNNNEDIQEPATYSVSARWDAGEVPLCPQDCYWSGFCIDNAVCLCHPGYGGQYCQGIQTSIALGDQYTGTVQPGSWVFHALDLRDPASRSKALVLEFDNNAGHGIVIASFGVYPTILTANFTFRAGQTMQGATTFTIQPASLQPDTLYIGIYDMDFYSHQGFTYHLRIAPVKSSGLNITPYLSLVLAICVCIVLALLASIWRHIILRRRGQQGLFRRPFWGGRAAVAVPVVQPRRVRRGLDSALVHTFPLSTYRAGKLIIEQEVPKPPESPASPAGTVTATVTVSETSPEEQSCSVCLAEYEDGDVIRSLPCNHDFHMKCIDQWLVNHSTCPMCRVSLGPEVPPGSPTRTDAATAEVAQPEPQNRNRSRGVQLAQIIVDRGLRRQRGDEAADGAGSRTTAATADASAASSEPPAAAVQQGTATGQEGSLRTPQQAGTQSNSHLPAIETGQASSDY